MKAWQLNGYEGIRSIRLVDVPEPVPAPGEVVLKMQYAALNPADRYLAEAQYPARPTFPHVMGREGLGTIVATGEGVSNWRVGDQCLILTGDIGADRWGTFAQKVAVSADQLVRPPGEWTAQEAAGSVVVYLTAWQALSQWGERSDGIVLVTGASGGVGTAAVQLASAMNSRVIALTRSDKKADALRQLGASIVCNSDQALWTKRLKEELGNDRVDLAVDNIGGTLLPQVIDVMGMNGRISVVGRLAGPVPEFNTATLFFRRLRIGGVAVGSWTPAEMREEWRIILSVMDAGNKRPIVDKVFPMDKLPEAFERLEQGPIGKVVLDVQA